MMTTIECSVRSIEDERREKQRAASKRHYENNRGAVIARTTANRRLRLMGVTPEMWDAMFAAQGSRCAICSTDDPKHNGSWATDHDHATGEVRGILCNPCNLGLGKFKDCPEILANAISYLNKN